MKSRAKMTSGLMMLCCLGIGVSHSYALTKDLPRYPGLVFETITVPFDRGSIGITPLLELDLRTLACMTSDEVIKTNVVIRILERWPDGGPAERDLGAQRMNKVVSIFMQAGVAAKSIRKEYLYPPDDRDLEIKDKFVIVVRAPVRKSGLEEKRKNCRAMKVPKRDQH